MDNLKGTMGKVMDSLKQDQAKEPTGSVEHCPKHPEDRLYERREFRYGEIEITMVCHSCDTEQRAETERKNRISDCHRELDLPERLAGLSFDNYLPVNKKAEKIKKTCMKYAELVFSRSAGGLILLGGVGTGKTHLAVAICKQLCDRGMFAKLTSVPKMIRDIRSSWSGHATDRFGRAMTEDAVISEYATHHLLVIDEIGIQYGSAAEKISVSEVINERYNRMAPTVIIGNVKLSEAEDYLGARVIDRIKDNGQILIFDWESHRKQKEPM